MTTLDARVARLMEPRAATPPRRLKAIERLAEAGVPVTVMTAPIIPVLKEHEIEAILAPARTAGAESAAYVLLRLPLELKSLFGEWLVENFPDRANRVILVVQSMNGGRDYSSEFGLRQRGSGPYAEMIAQRFRNTVRRLGHNQRRDSLRTDLVAPPVPNGGQLALF